MNRIKNLKQVDLNKILNEYKDLAIQVLQIGYIRNFVKEYRYKRAEKLKGYNIFNTTIHVAMENFYLLLLWKLFDKKRSKLTIYDISDRIQCSKFKQFFNKEIQEIEKEINTLSQWRNRIICHRDISVHFNSNQLEDEFPLDNEEIDKLTNFLFEFWCQLDFSLHRIPIDKLKIQYKKELESLKKFCFKATKDILENFPINYDSS